MDYQAPRNSWGDSEKTIACFKRGYYNKIFFFVKILLRIPTKEERLNFNKKWKTTLWEHFDFSKFIITLTRLVYLQACIFSFTRLELMDRELWFSIHSFNIKSIVLHNTLHSKDTSSIYSYVFFTWQSLVKCISLSHSSWLINNNRKIKNDQNNHWSKWC